MNAHDRLRLYLEQRRELGESELVLDGLPVEAVLKMIGAPTGKTTSTRSHADSAAPANNPRADDRTRASEVPEASPSDVAPSANAEPIAERIAPADPAPRFSSNATTDWRAALGHLAPGGEKASQRASSAGDATAPNAPGAARGDASEASSDAGDESSSAVISDRAAPTQTTAADFPAWLTNLGIPVGLSAGGFGASATSPVANACNSLDELATAIAACRACSLGASATHPVPGEGNSDADFVCVGEAPGQTEDETGRPFVGAAGQLLTKILAAIQLSREDVFICNVLKHRPPGNRNPAPDEIAACAPYLTRQLALVKPKVILALGTFAAQTLLNTTTSLGKLRGQVHRYNGVPLIVTYHPAALLRNENWKRPTWDDVKLARKILDAARGNSADGITAS